MGTVTFDFRDFRKIRVDQAVSIEIVKSDSYSVTATAEDVSHVRVEMSDDTLRIGRRALGLFAFFRDRPRITVASPELDEIVLMGASTGKIQGYKSDRAVTVKLSGASHLDVQELTCGSLEADISGASNLVMDAIAWADAHFSVTGASRVEASGNGTRARIDLSGASQARLHKMALNDASVAISGASNAQLTLNGKLDIALSGASKLEYAGNASLGDVKVTGASTLTRK